MWKYFEPKFEYEEKFQDLAWPWAGHKYFAYDLIANIKPKVIVELGTHYGTSLWAFSQAVKDKNINTELNAVDTWEGEKHAGFYGEEVFEKVKDIKNTYYSELKINLIRKTFDEAISGFEDNSIDILHIDGLHTYEAVKHDFENWLPKVKENGIILFHDIVVNRDDFGVYKFWKELKEKYKTMEFRHSYGLGILFKGKDNLLFGSKEELELHYSYLLEDIENGNISNILDASNKKEQEIDRKEKIIENLDEVIKQNKKETENLNQTIIQKDQEIDALRNSTSWKITKPIRFIKDKILKILRIIKKVFFILRREGVVIFFKKSFRYLLNKFNFLFHKIILKTKKILPESIKSILRPYFNKLISIRHKNLESIFKIDKIELEKQKIVKFEYSPIISIIVPTYNTPKKILEEMIESVINQTYSNWELCIADGNSKKETKDILENFLKKDSRIKVIFLDKNEGISNNSNKAIEISTGEYVAFLDHDDLLEPFALFEILTRINLDKKIDIIYSDEDKTTPNGKEYFCRFFKPDWSPEFFMGVMYVGHFLVVRKSLVLEVGLFNKDFDKIQDYELMLRLSEKTNNIVHIPKILYHWRSIPGSIASSTQAKGDIDNLQEKAVNLHLKRIGLNGFSKNIGVPHRLNIYPLKKDKYPMVSIIIPTKDNGKFLENCLKSLVNNTNYPNYEIIIIDNNTTERKAIDVMRKYPVKIIKYNDEFNFSKINNIGVNNSNGEYLIFLNNDTEIIDSDWVKNMLYYAEQKDVGAVGPMLIYPDNTVQHAGVVLGFRGTADHIMRDFPSNSDGYFGSLCCAREVSAVTAACIMIKKSVFKEVEGFNKHYQTIYQDVDLCLKIRDKKYRIIYTPLVKLIHHESKSRGNDYNYLDRLLLLDLWEDVIKKRDPYYNVNFDLNKYSKNNTGYNL